MAVERVLIRFFTYYFWNINSIDIIIYSIDSWYLVIPMEKDTKVVKQFLKSDFVGGILVEYQDGCGFDIEFGRGTIQRFIVKENKLLIITDGEALMQVGDIEKIKITKVEGIYYLVNSELWNYAIAPEGVEIAVKPCSVHEYVECRVS